MKTVYKITNKINRQSIGKCIAGSSRYSTVGGRIWRKAGEE